MNSMIRHEDAKKLVGRYIYVIKQDGSPIEGKLLRVRGNKLILKQPGKAVSTKAILPLALFDVLAIGTLPYAYGGYPYGYGYGYGGYGYPYFW